MSADSSWPIWLCKMWILNPVFSKCLFPRRCPPKNGVFDGGVASFHTEKLALSLRVCCNDFKLAASSTKGVSTMQKESEMKTVLGSRGRRRTRTIWRLNRWYCLSTEIHSYSSGPLGPSKSRVTIGAQYNLYKATPSCIPVSGQGFFKSRCLMSLASNMTTKFHCRERQSKRVKCKAVSTHRTACAGQNCILLKWVRSAD